MMSIRELFKDCYFILVFLEKTCLKNDHILIHMSVATYRVNINDNQLCLCRYVKRFYSKFNSCNFKSCKNPKKV